ncbi:MAG: acyl-CoA dehydrogenase [Planctomycetes bacterium]|jgi:alkylation response protein AidB-like acyl-CoA dehydrogenase|nr:acyl-CoA dehydrogenase [Planctomycetota bacterium]MBT4029194.1 acyl-CoA dehydrogenase [Planctomycetota bacterium]MBT4559275.1 acyl-CoA dehydrogenase [Planctomycetota bacterium]MBT5101993.1 acyl-CoA dehydrogenase [Planctomycetota bacterium]MBT5120294.1 acyl-CoA dehydrogenase [Planctomycetota bacterium]
MKFELDKAQKDIQKAAKRFAKGEFDKELALELETTHTYPMDIWRKACEEGFIGLHFPDQYGGSDFGQLENVLVLEQFCQRDSGIGAAMLTAPFACEIILHHGTDEQKEKYLNQVTSGEAISAGAFTEPAHGSDITSMATTAVKDGDEWLINGVKTFITNAGICGFYVLLVQTDAEAGHKGQSMFIVDADAPGIDVASVGEKMGLKMIPTGEVSFKDVRVPASSLLGVENKGFYQVLQFFDESRLGVAAQALGTAQGAFDRAVEYVKGREQFGQKIGKFQALQHKIAEMATQLELARLITYKAAWLADNKKPDAKLSAMAKYYAGKIASEVASESMQLLGGYGYITEFEVERFYRDARITEIYEGTREIQKNIIAGHVLGRF